MKEIDCVKQEFRSRREGGRLIRSNIVKTVHAATSNFMNTCEIKVYNYRCIFVFFDFRLNYYQLKWRTIVV